MVNVPGESKMYELECGHKKRLKIKTAEKGEVFCFSCQKSKKVGDPLEA